jgi:hypothetical protein
MSPARKNSNSRSGTTFLFIRDPRAAVAYTKCEGKVNSPKRSGCEGRQLEISCQKKKRRESLRGVSRPAFRMPTRLAVGFGLDALEASGLIHPGRWQAVTQLVPPLLGAEDSASKTAATSAAPVSVGSKAREVKQVRRWWSRAHPCESGTARGIRQMPV